MCFDGDSEPPVPRISGAAVSHESLVLEAEDGNRFAAFLAQPEQLAASGVVILPDVRGLYHFYEELALRFAERGVAAIAIDYYARTAGAEKRGEDFDYVPHRDATKDATIQRDVAAAVAHLRGLGCRSIFTVGFCFGGRNSWLAATSGHDLAGAVGFYGSPTRERDGGTVVEHVNDITCPILALQAGNDEGITAEDNAAFEAALTGAGVEHELVVYDGAPHSFFDRKYDEFADASADAWSRTLAFIAQRA